MKKILAILALMIMVTILASCGAKEGSKGEELGEGTKVESAEKVTSKVKTPVSTPLKISNKNDIVKNISNGTKTLSGSTGTGKTEDQVVKDFEKELDGLFKLLESNPNAK